MEDVLSESRHAPDRNSKYPEPLLPLQGGQEAPGPSDNGFVTPAKRNADGQPRPSEQVRLHALWRFLKRMHAFTRRMRALCILMTPAPVQQQAASLEARFAAELLIMQEPMAAASGPDVDSDTDEEQNEEILHGRRAKMAAALALDKGAWLPQSACSKSTKDGRRTAVGMFVCRGGSAAWHRRQPFRHADLAVDAEGRARAQPAIGCQARGWTQAGQATDQGRQAQQEGPAGHLSAPLLVLRGPPARVAHRELVRCFSFVAIMHAERLAHACLRRLDMRRLDQIVAAYDYVAGNCIPCCALCNSRKGQLRVVDFVATLDPSWTPHSEGLRCVSHYQTAACMQRCRLTKCGRHGVRSELEEVFWATVAAEIMATV